MKIVNTDKHGSDYPNEKLVAKGIACKPYADVMCKALNDKFSGDYADRYYKVVEDNYKLIPGFGP